ncbi:hypothetical protein IMSAG049_00544 [Clostridiales bacterium]|nr:hypothetical protein IMSAG049_00544 [Clostridiales bacterium]
MGENTRSKGSLAEGMTARWLVKNKGYEILERNFRCITGEIDIIARDKGVYVFIEVKFRRNLRHGYPSEAVTLMKQKRIINTAMMYLQKNNGTEARFDVAEIVEQKGKYFIRYIENAFEWRNCL